jgi:DNA-binding transcriptional ArsR family regulator
MTDLCNEIERFGKGIGNACRYRIVEALFSGRRTVGELVAAVGQSQPAVSQHLKVLKACGIVTDERKGQEVYYALNAEYALRLLKSLTENLRKQRKSRR